MIDENNIEVIEDEVFEEPIEEIIREDKKEIVQKDENIFFDFTEIPKKSNLKTSNNALSIEYHIPWTGLNWEWYRVEYNGVEQYFRVGQIPLGSQYAIEFNGGHRLPSTGYYVRGEETTVNVGSNGITGAYFTYSTSWSMNDLNKLTIYVLKDPTKNILERIENKQEDLKDYVEDIPNNPFFVSVFGKSDNNNQISGVGMVSQNIMTTPINEYGLSDSMSLILILMAIAGVMIYVIHKSILKWGK